VLISIQNVFLTVIHSESNHYCICGGSSDNLEHQCT